MRCLGKSGMADLGGGASEDLFRFEARSHCFLARLSPRFGLGGRSAPQCGRARGTKSGLVSPGQDALARAFVGSEPLSDCH